MAKFKTAAVLVCAGSGSRMKGCCPDKLLLEFSGMPVAAHAISSFDNTEGIDLIVVVTRPENVEVYRSFKEKYNYKKELIVTTGGASRTESVLNGVRVVPEKFDFIAIADGARPLVRIGDIKKTMDDAFKYGAAALGSYVTDTVKEITDGMIRRTLPREKLVAIQTPQIFNRREYLELATNALDSGIEFTDDASIYEYYGKNVCFTEGHRDNIKITAPEDIAVLQAMVDD